MAAVDVKAEVGAVAPPLEQGVGHRAFNGFPGLRVCQFEYRGRFHAPGAWGSAFTERSLES